MFRYMIIVLIIISISAGFTEVMKRWDKHIDVKNEQWQESQRSTIGLPKGVAVEVGGIKVDATEGTITLCTHIKFDDTYYYIELVFPAKEEQKDDANEN